MENIQLAQIIKNTCKLKKVSITKLLNECNIRKSLIYDLEKRDYTPSVATIEQIANYLDCSVDYLLGRTDNPNGCSGDNITIGDTNGNYNMTVGKGETKSLQIDGLSKEMLEKFECLDFDKKVEVMALISNLSKK